MRNASTPYPSDSTHPMVINGLNVCQTNPMTAITANDHNDCSTMCLPVAIKSEPKPKSKPSESHSPRATKRPPSERRFKCDQCDRMFFTRKDVKRHLVVHTGIRNFACPFCTQRFGRKDHLVRHAKKSHNRDTRSSTVKNSSLVSQQTKAEPKANGAPVVANGCPPPALNQSKQMNYQNKNYQTNCQNNDQSCQSSLVLLGNQSNHNHINAINNSHITSDPMVTNGSGHCVSYTHPNQNPCHTNHVMIGGMHANDSLCQYMTGHSVHPLDDISPNGHIKSETPPMAAHHYLTFPVSSGGLNYPLASGPFLANCFVANSPAGHPSHVPLGSCATSASVAAFGIPVSGVAGPQSPFVDVNTSLPHFNQAFQ